MKPLRIILPERFLGLGGIPKGPHAHGLRQFHHSRLMLILLFLYFSIGLHASPETVEEFTPLNYTIPEIEAAARSEHAWFDIKVWGDRGMLIRSGSDVQCLSNLSWALNNSNQLSTAEYAGAAGALSLLPTASAILGAPTREMWVLFRLVPFAGILSMFLSLGGNVTPSKAGDYDPNTSYDYGGIMPTKPRRRHKRRKSEADAFDEDDKTRATRDATHFAGEVYDRACDDVGGSYRKIWIGVAVQLTMTVVLLIAMWYCQRGAIIPWWCLNWGWMYFWYALVTATSIFDNMVAAPFGKNHTMRICKAPNNLRISDTASQLMNNKNKTALVRIQEGINTKNRVTMDPLAPATLSATCFYAIISVEKNSPIHATLKILSQGATVAVYAFGTTLFASAQLLSVSVALMLLSLVFTAGVLGRVAAMWMAAEMNSDNQAVLHTVVKSDEEAAEHVQKIMELKGLMIEMKGHLIIDGVCIMRRNRLTSLSTYIGLLAGPYDIIRLALKGLQGRRYLPRISEQSLMSDWTPGSQAEQIELGAQAQPGSRYQQVSVEQEPEPT